MEKVRQQIMLDAGNYEYVLGKACQYHSKNISTTINIILKEHKYLITMMEKQQKQAGIEPTYKEVREKQISKKV